MFTYCVTFRIGNGTVEGKTYQDRYNQLLDNITGEGGAYWGEPTSFYFVQSSLITPEFSKKTVRGLSPKDDLVVVFDPSDMSANYFGPIEHVDVLLGFLPTAKKLA
ncbi:hypothetical protein [Microvirga calopogonii]|uniref:hypothetical protein n=1 Tax=Microvirga calopogonii TaxID=2078013 RepID=UPI000E0D82CD|nr:hypothetical protein [Microvirga calopogonii]